MTTSPPDPLHACAFSLHSLSYVLPSLPHTFSPDNGHSSSRGQRHSWWPLALTKHWEFGAKHFTKSQITVENKNTESANSIKSNLSFLTLCYRKLTWSKGSENINKLYLLNSHASMWSVGLSAGWSIGQSVYPLAGRLVGQPVVWWMDQSVGRSGSHSVGRTVGRSA